MKRNKSQRLLKKIKETLDAYGYEHTEDSEPESGEESSEDSEEAQSGV